MSENITRNKKLAICAVLSLLKHYRDEMDYFEEEERLYEDWGNVIFFHKINRVPRVRIFRYSEQLVASYSSQEFKAHFRMDRSSFEKLMQYLSTKKPTKMTCGNPEILIGKQIQITLWILGNQEVFRSVAERFGVSLSTAWISVRKICQLLVDNCADFINWPEGRRASVEMEKWRSISGIPGIVGAIDGCYIPISTPSLHQESYVCRKKFHALNMQAVCTSDKKFISVDIGAPGSMHDARVFWKSDLFEQIEIDQNASFPGNSHLIGDSAYPLCEYLLVPFKRYGDLSAGQKVYDKELSASRVRNEQSFGLLKCRFRRLNYVYMRSTELIPLIVLSCCILHNICINYGDQFEYETDFSDIDIDIQLDNEENSERHTRGTAKRNFIMNYLINNIRTN